MSDADPITRTDTALREHLVMLLTSAWAHVTAEDGIAGVPPDQRGARPTDHAHTIWQLLEHLRICQDDLVEYSRDPSHVSRDFPQGYWPESDVPEDEEAWQASVEAFMNGLQEMVSLVSDPSRDLFEPFTWSDEGHTLLREALILADHNAYHLGQIVQLKKALGVGRQGKAVRETLGFLAVVPFLFVFGACDRPAPIEVVETTIAEVQAAIASGATTCRMVVEAHIERIEAYEDRINAITVMNPNALARADSIDDAISAGEQLGDLFCVPMLVKDNFDTHDMITTGGSIALMESIPPDDAFMVRRIREEDAIVIAKTNMAEWAFSPRQTVSSSFDTTRNAYALDRVPAGSSGGTASGVAASFGLIGLGSDTGNSIRGPSSHLALVGIRSTIGLTSRDGVIPLAFDRDVAGPMGRTVEDVARVFNVVAGYDPADPYTADGRGRKEDDYTSFLDVSGLQGVRLGVLRVLVDTEDADTAVIRVFEQAVADLQRLGAEVVDFDFDVRAQSRRPNMGCGRFRYDMGQYLASLGDAAPIRDVMEVLETGQHSDDAEASLRRNSRRSLDVHPADRDPPCPDYLENEGRQGFRADLVAAMDDAGLEAILYPSWTNPPAHIDRANEEYRGDNSQRVAPATGLPAITVPMGYTYDDYPAGLQILGRAYAEGVLFRLAYAYEQGTQHRHPPRGFDELVEVAN